jgi:hypothetical protein
MLVADPSLRALDVKPLAILIGHGRDPLLSQKGGHFISKDNSATSGST